MSHNSRSHTTTKRILTSDRPAELESMTPPMLSLATLQEYLGLRSAMTYQSECPAVLAAELSCAACNAWRWLKLAIELSSLTIAFITCQLSLSRRKEVTKGSASVVRAAALNKRSWMCMSRKRPICRRSF